LVVGSFDESSHPGSHLVENKYQRLPPIHILMRASARERERERESSRESTECHISEGWL
jgi:hypothetical protein